MKILYPTDGELLQYDHFGNFTGILPWFSCDSKEDVIFISIIKISLPPLMWKDSDECPIEAPDMLVAKFTREPRSESTSGSVYRLQSVS